MNHLTTWPDRDEESQLLTQLQTGIRTASNDFATRYLLLLMGYLATAYPRVDPELRDDAADRAILSFLISPQKYDPSRGGLGAYLRLSAQGDLLNLLATERRLRRGVPLDSVAEPADQRNTTQDDELTWDDPRLVAERAAFTPEEELTFALMRCGTRDSLTIARHLGLAHLPNAEQSRAVKRLKDRVKKRLVRAVEDLQ